MRTLLAVLATGALLTAAGCGSYHDHRDVGGPKPATANGADASFAAEMAEHHQGAIHMARIARRRAEHPEIRRLARSIESTQQAEIRVLKHLGEELHDEGEHAGGHGMAHADLPALRRAKPFDRAFIDAMIPHHEDAIEMSQKVIAEGEHPDLRRMAKAIITAQAGEIRQMRAWRERWYGT